VRFGLARFGLSLSTHAAILVASQAVVRAACCILGVLIFLRRPTGRFGWLMALILVWMGTVVPVQAYALAEVYPALGFAGYVANQIATAVAVVLLWIFPDGRFVPGWSRWTLVLALVCAFIAPLLPNAPMTNALVVPLALVLIGSGLVSQIYRYVRVSRPVERQQTKWVMVALVMAPLAWVVGGLLIPTTFPSLVRISENTAPYNLLRLTIANIANLFIPLAMGLAILRYRLWDIDVIIRKTLVYSALTVLLALVYFGSVVLLQRLFGLLTGVAQSPLAVVVSTLVIAALFTPLRRRIQDAIDRRFFRKKYDAQRVLAQFAQTARDETDLDALTGELARVVQETMQPEGVSVWLKESKSPKGG